MGTEAGRAVRSRPAGAESPLDGSWTRLKGKRGLKVRQMEVAVGLGPRGLTSRCSQLRGDDGHRTPDGPGTRVAYAPPEPSGRPRGFGVSLGKQKRIEKGGRDRSLCGQRSREAGHLRGYGYVGRFLEPGLCLLWPPHVSLVMSCRTSRISAECFIISSRVKGSPR